jgi:uncharacterized membrane protein HdeD (DUF308 family)
MANPILKNWWLLLIRGICSILFGILAITLPHITLWVLITMFGVYVLFDSAAALMVGLSGRLNGGIWWGMVLLGVLGTIAGITALTWPGETVVILLMVIAFWAIMRGLTEIIAAIALRKHIEDEWVLIIGGLMSILFGALMLVHPAAGALAVILLIGAFSLAAGMTQISLAFRLRRFGHRVQSLAAG